MRDRTDGCMHGHHTVGTLPGGEAGRPSLEQSILHICHKELSGQRTLMLLAFFSLAQTSHFSVFRSPSFLCSFLPRLGPSRPRMKGGVGCRRQYSQSRAAGIGCCRLPNSHLHRATNTWRQHVAAWRQHRGPPTAMTSSSFSACHHDAFSYGCRVP